MKFYPLELEGVFLIELDLIKDDRGHFARTYCQEEFLAYGLNPNLEQCSISYNKHKHTVRGMHFQSEPHEEEKLVSCIQGAIFDVIIDLRPNSKTYLKWVGIELTAANNKQLYVPKGFAHGFQTLIQDSKVFYQITKKYHPASARGVRWNDPAFGIHWPESINIVLSEKDKTYQDYLS